MKKESKLYIKGKLKNIIKNTHYQFWCLLDSLKTFFSCDLHSLIVLDEPMWNESLGNLCTINDKRVLRYFIASIENIKSITAIKCKYLCNSILRLSFGTELKS